LSETSAALSGNWLISSSLKFALCDSFPVPLDELLLQLKIEGESWKVAAVALAGGVKSSKRDEGSPLMSSKK